MPSYSRYAIYYLPPEGELSRFGAYWLGWDCLNGKTAPQPEIEKIAEATEAPRKYGFHGTLKPPFRLSYGHEPDELRNAIADLAATLPPVKLDGLVLDRLGEFLALRPVGDTSELVQLAARCVAETDRFRAPPTPDEAARRRKAGLTPRQEELLQQWGYPYVLDEFRFHMTLTGSLDEADLTRFHDEIARRLPPQLTPYIIDSIALARQRPDGMFTLIDRFALEG